MARPLRIELAGGHYHVMNRGNNRQDIFLSDKDRNAFMEALADSCEIYDVNLIAYVLMTNHFHLLVHTARANLSEFMRHFQVTYTVRFNRRQGDGDVHKYINNSTIDEVKWGRLCFYAFLSMIRKKGAMKY